MTNRSQSESSNQNLKDDPVKDALKLTHALNKHILENCPHCQALSQDALKDE